MACRHVNAQIRRWGVQRYSGWTIAAPGTAMARHTVRLVDLLTTAQRSRISRNGILVAGLLNRFGRKTTRDDASAKHCRRQADQNGGLPRPLPGPAQAFRSG